MEFLIAHTLVMISSGSFVRGHFPLGNSRGGGEMVSPLCFLVAAHLIFVKFFKQALFFPNFLETRDIFDSGQNFFHIFILRISTVFQLSNMFIGSL